MKIVDAIWEKRNLGVDTQEITIEQHDNCDEVDKILNEIKVPYCVVKIPSYRPELLEVVQNNGFRYIEDMVYVVNYLQEIRFSPVQKRMYDSVNIATMNRDDIDELCEEIKNGIFDSDRIFLDRHFSHEIARQRYVNWVLDEYDRGTEFVKYIYKGNTIGFFGLKEIESGHYTSFLGGIYEKYRKGGIGTVVKVPEAVRMRGGKKVSTSVSTNNVIQLKSLMMNGYIPESILHTFIKHS